MEELTPLRQAELEESKRALEALDNGTSEWHKDLAKYHKDAKLKEYYLSKRVCAYKVAPQNEEIDLDESC
jgi:ribosomal protein L32